MMLNNAAGGRGESYISMLIFKGALTNANMAHVG